MCKTAKEKIVKREIVSSLTKNEPLYGSICRYSLIRSQKNQFRFSGSFIVHLIVPLGGVYTSQIKKNSVAPWKKDGVVPQGSGRGGGGKF